MGNHAGRPLDVGTRVFLTAAVVVALVAMAILMAPRLSAQSSAQTPAVQSPDRPAFEVASIKVNKSSGPQRPSPARLTLQPGGRLTTNSLRLRDLMQYAYHLFPYQWLHISGLPDWSASEYFDIEAKAAGNPGADQIRLMMQSLLADRFQLVVYWETRQLPVYALVVSKPGELGRQLHRHTDDSKCIDRSTQRPSPPIPDCGVLTGLPNGQMVYRVTMDQLAMQLGNFLPDRPVVNQTGLSGTFDLSLSLELATKADQAAGLVDPSGATSIFTALQEQLGLKLQGQAGTVDVLVIDHVEEPSEN